MIKRLNIRNLVIVLVILALVHFSVGLFISPKLGEFAVGKINQYSKAKISLQQINVWPLTLSVSLKNLKIFDPDNTNNKIAEIKLASVYISPLGLLSKRLVLSEIKISGANIYLESEPDGSFNIQKLAQPKVSGKPAAPAGAVESALQKKDWFGKGYNLLKKKFSSDAVKKEKAQATEAKKITKAVKVLPRGRRVIFKSKDSYLFEIKRLIIEDSNLSLKDQNCRPVQLEEVRIELGNAAFDPQLGLRLGKAEIEGNLKSAGVAAGSLKFYFGRTFNKGQSKAHFDLGLKKVNLDALRFIYENSLPVEIVKGTLDLDSETLVENGNLNSSNKLSLSNHELKSKSSTGPVDISLPMSASLFCDTLNTINPLRLNFTISGTLDKPEFGGLTRSLTDLVKPNLKNVGQMIKGQVNKNGIAGAQDAVNSLQSLFGIKKQDSQK